MASLGKRSSGGGVSRRPAVGQRQIDGSVYLRRRQAAKRRPASEAAAESRVASRPSREAALYLSSVKDCYGEENEGGEGDGSREVVCVQEVCKPCRCRCTFCDHCSRALARVLRPRVVGQLCRWKGGITGLTFTVDPDLFAGDPEAAYRFVKGNRLIARTVAGLFRRGWLIAQRWFAVVEFQGEKTGYMPHWHVLVESKFVPHGEVVEIWSSWRPAEAGPLEWKVGSPERAVREVRVTAENYRALERVAFGSVAFSRSRSGVLGAAVAARYCLAYLIKPPKAGWPDWVLDFDGIIRRHEVSRSHKGNGNGFWDACHRHPDDCFCEVCQGEAEVSDLEAVERLKSVPSGVRVRRRSVRERLAKCGQGVCFVKREFVRLPNGLIVVNHRFLGALPVSLEEVRGFLGCEVVEGREEVELESGEMQRVYGYEEEKRTGIKRRGNPDWSYWV